MVKKIALEIYNKLEETRSKNVDLQIKGSEYSIIEYKFETSAEFTDFDTISINFNYSNEPMPKLEDIENILNIIFKGAM